VGRFRRASCRRGAGRQSRSAEEVGMAPVWLRAKVALDHVMEHTILPDIAERELIVRLTKGLIHCRAERLN
jgi:hypothetical protein